MEILQLIILPALITRWYLAKAFRIQTKKPNLAAELFVSSILVVSNHALNMVTPLMRVTDDGHGMMS